MIYIDFPAFHDELDFVSVHEALLQEFKSVLESIRGRQSLDTQIDTILNAKASSLSDRRALSRVRPIVFGIFSIVLTDISFFRSSRN